MLMKLSTYNIRTMRTESDVLALIEVLAFIKWNNISKRLEKNIVEFHSVNERLASAIIKINNEYNL